MKIDLTKTFKDSKGKDIMDANKFYITDILKLLAQNGVTIPENVAELAKDIEPVTLETVIFEAVSTVTKLESNKNMSGKDKYTYYKIAQKLNGKEIDLEAEEVTKVKEAIGKVYNDVLLLGQAWDILEAKDKK